MLSSWLYLDVWQLNKLKDKYFSILWFYNYFSVRKHKNISVWGVTPSQTPNASTLMRLELQGCAYFG